MGAFAGERLRVVVGAQGRMSMLGLRRQDWEEESGQTTLLILGMVTILLMLAAVVISATSVNVQARQLLSEADAAVSAAAASAPPVPGAPQLTEGQVRSAAEQYLSDSGAFDRHAGVEVIDAWMSSGGETISVQLGAQAELPGLRWALPARVEITAESHARITLSR